MDCVHFLFSTTTCWTQFDTQFPTQYWDAMICVGASALFHQCMREKRAWRNGVVSLKKNHCRHCNVTNRSGGFDSIALLAIKLKYESNNLIFQMCTGLLQWHFPQRCAPTLTRYLRALCTTLGPFGSSRYISQSCAGTICREKKRLQNVDSLRSIWKSLK